MAQDTTVANRYMARLRELGEREDAVGRFYVATTDEELLDLERQLDDVGAALVLHNPVLALYRRWKDEMGPEKWAEVWAYNESLGDADRNWLVSEDMDSAVEAIV